MPLLERKGRSTGAETSAAETAAAPGDIASSANWMQERTRVAVGRGVTVAGKLIFNEPVRIEGHFRGEVVSVDLVVISDEATVEGKVQARRLVVMGELRGDVAGSGKVYIGPHARVSGNISAENLTVCEGAYFDGRIRMTGTD
jgi:cytoskeletal protein CcmA (bactofilin family)